MGTKRNDKSSADKQSAQPRNDALYLIGAMADTTWRMFVPTIGLAVIGDALDRQNGTKPWLLLLGAAIGAAIATFLVKRQLTKGNKT